MKIVIAAVGKMGRSAEADLTARYIKRASDMGGRLGIRGVTLIERGESKDRSDSVRKEVEAADLLAATGTVDRAIVLDEHGDMLTSRQFAGLLSQYRDGGAANCALFIGGPDGHGDSVRNIASKTLSLGRMTLPHLMARAILAEQIYRAMTIMAGHPYHRD